MSRTCVESFGLALCIAIALPWSANCCGERFSAKAPSTDLGLGAHNVTVALESQSFKTAESRCSGDMRPDAVLHVDISLSPPLFGRYEISKTGLLEYSPSMMVAGCSAPNPLLYQVKLGPMNWDVDKALRVAKAAGTCDAPGIIVFKPPSRIKKQH